MSAFELFQFAFFKDFDLDIGKLASIAAPEDWNFSNEQSKTNKILKNYLEHTFRKLRTDSKLMYTSDNHFACFNTGLFTLNYESIFTLFEKNRNPPANNPSQLFFKGFYKESDTALLTIFSGKLPERANYFDDPSLLIFDTKLDIVPDIEHIIEDNAARFPKNLNRDARRILLSGAIEETKKKVRANYTIAIPQYYSGRIQLLLPLCLTPGSPNPDLALVLDKLTGVYKSNTCLTVQMAYNNARLIVKPYSNWLQP